MVMQFKFALILTRNKSVFFFWFGVGFGLWCLTPLSMIFQLYRGSQFIGEGNQSTRRKPQTYRKSLTNFIT
jgi:hypothetical protein